MGMPVTVEVVDADVTSENLEEVFSYFEYVDDTFSTYKDSSEITRINNGEIGESGLSSDMREIFRLAEETKKETSGYFDIVAPGGGYDPSGLVKGWAIRNAADILRGRGFENFYVDAGGDIEVSGTNAEGRAWRIGIRNPFNTAEIVKTVVLKRGGMATSGTYERGKHIYNPRGGNKPVSEIVSLSVIGPDIYEADRFATAAFAMGREGILFIERREGLEGYLIDEKGVATMTSGFEKYVCT